MAEGTILNVIRFALVPVITSVAGASFAVLRPPKGTFRSYIQHFAAGVVFSVVAVELLPDIVKRHLPWEVAIGFGAGVIAMLSIKALIGKMEISRGNRSSSSTMLIGVGIDIFIDGLLIGIGFTAGSKEGALLTFALSVELLSLGLAIAFSLLQDGASSWKTVGTVTALSLLILIGAVFGATFLRVVSSEVMEVVLAFGLAALLFLVTEELLVEAHEEPETPTATAMFFLGFLLFLIIGMIS